MIIDHIRNREKYYFLGEDYQKALDYFAGVPGVPFEKADIRIDGGRILIKARPMTSRPIEECSFEAHRLYADIHFVAYGVEKIGYADVSALQALSYDETKDVSALKGDGDLLTLRAGYFMIVLADDAHMPCVCGEAGPVPLGKMIAKIKL